MKLEIQWNARLLWAICAAIYLLWSIGARRA